VHDRVHEYYWTYDWNCAVTTLCVLAEVFHITLSDQVFEAALGMHGAGGYGAQCGLVEGVIMFIGVAAKAEGLSHDAIAPACADYAQRSESRFGSLLCRELRSGGFSTDNPPHLCEKLTRDAIAFVTGLLKDLL
jgi:hypothetical protein